MKAVFINAKDQTVTDVEVNDTDTLHHWYKIMGVDLVTIGYYLDEHDSILVDDEGLLKPLDRFFYYQGANQPFAGNGLIVGVDDEGESVSANVTAQDVRDKIKFMNIDDVVNHVHARLTDEA